MANLPTTPQKPPLRKNVEDSQKGKLYYTKCGRTFKKNSTASTTGYECNNDLQCQVCPFRETKRRYKEGEAVDLFECRAGDKEPNKKNEYNTLNLNDSSHLSIYSIDYYWLEKIKTELSNIEGVEGTYYNQDLPDCRKVLSIGFTKNKTGVKAKKNIVAKYFN